MIRRRRAAILHHTHRPDRLPERNAVRRTHRTQSKPKRPPRADSRDGLERKSHHHHRQNLRIPFRLGQLRRIGAPLRSLDHLKQLRFRWWRVQQLPAFQKVEIKSPLRFCLVRHTCCVGRSQSHCQNVALFPIVRCFENTQGCRNNVSASAPQWRHHPKASFQELIEGFILAALFRHQESPIRGPERQR